MQVPSFVPLSHRSGSLFGVDTEDSTDAGTYSVNVLASQAQGQGTEQLHLEASFTLIIEPEETTGSAGGEIQCDDMDFACLIMLSVDSG